MSPLFRTSQITKIIHILFIIRYDSKFLATGLSEMASQGMDMKNLRLEGGGV